MCGLYRIKTPRAIGIMHRMHSQKVRTIVIGIFILIGIVFALGKIRYAVNPYVRAQRLDSFIRSVEQTKTIDPEVFWEFRDFYSATTSSFKPQNIESDKPFLTFKTSYFSSSDSLLANPPSITLPLSSDVDTLIFQDSSSVVYKTNRTLHIRFTKPQSDMLRANGFFRYFGVDLEKYKDYAWYNETVIDL